MVITQQTAGMRMRLRAINASKAAVQPEMRGPAPARERLPERHASDKGANRLFSTAEIGMIGSPR
jgi:hypothetical protein